MYLKQIADEVGDSLNDTTLKSTGVNYSRTKQWINEFYVHDFLNLRDWEFTKREGLVQTTAQYTTGTALFTNGSTAVVGTSTVWGSTFIGRYILVDGERAYKITASGSSTSITMESGYEGTTGSKSYRIIKFRYNLPRWIDYPLRIQAIGSPTSGRTLTSTLRNSIARPFQGFEGQYNYVPGPRERTTYSTGTVSGTGGLKTLTGVGTSWVTAGIEQFDDIQIGSEVYKVDLINSATSITLFKNLIASVTAGSTYTAVMDRWTIEFGSYPTEAQSLYIRANAIVSPLDDDFDVPILPDNWQHILVKGAKLKALQHNSEDPSLAVIDLNNAVKSLISINARSDDRMDRFWL